MRSATNGRPESLEALFICYNMDDIILDIKLKVGICRIKWRDARVVEWDGLENRCAGNCTEGSNPSLSANRNNSTL